jgi:hypothetical protein
MTAIFTPTEFAEMVSTFGRWGVRIVFVPDDDLHDEPVVEVREPDARAVTRPCLKSHLHDLSICVNVWS